MFKRKVFNTIVSTGLILLVRSSDVWAQFNGLRGSGSTADPLAATNDFSNRMLDIVKGPVLKILAAVVLLVGVAGLLRGRHKLAISCGLAFLLLLFLPILLGHI